MATETLERGAVTITPDTGVPEANTSDGEAPPIFGRCPACGKPLHPRDRYTGEPKAPPVGQGLQSRAKCDKCGALIEYVGDGKWVVWLWMRQGPGAEGDGK
ncbi:MAG: hypothetical protein WC718_15855 [Phycisphaerales bacterium]|jgi:hypothetical protein